MSITLYWQCSWFLMTQVKAKRGLKLPSPKSSKNFSTLYVFKVSGDLKT